MMIKERLSSNYMFFRFPTYYALVLTALVAGITNFFINPFYPDDIIDSEINSLVLEKQYDALFNYLSVSKLVISVMCSFFITYRWTVISKDGSYGYLLTQGIDRRYFFIRSALMFLTNAYAGILGGILVLNFIGGINLVTEELIWIILLSFSSTFLVVSIAILFAEAFSLPELSTFAVIIVFGTNITLNTNRSSVWFKLFQSELLFESNNAILVFILSFGLGSIVMMIAYYLHTKLDVEL